MAEQVEKWLPKILFGAYASDEPSGVSADRGRSSADLMSWLSNEQGVEVVA